MKRSIDKQLVVSEIERTRIIAILRGDFEGLEVEIASVLAGCGISVLEVTLNSANALGVIKNIALNGKPNVQLGAGTVLSPVQVEQAFDAGASFIVSPNVSHAVIQRTSQLGMASFPGCFTCTEIVTALDAGADAAKIFPATAIKPDTIRALRAPLGSVRLIPTGGISYQNAPAYLDAGAWAVAVGSELVNGEAIKESGLGSLEERAMLLVNAVKRNC
jgi:2-dehydro-3-deoxyphosphogluconate aldolase / (4S)-4-hydroxy-2-oxoglutarate aldolase